MVTSDQNIRYQQNLARRKLALVVLGSNIWPVVQKHGAADNRHRRCGDARKVCVYRNAAPAETAKNGRALSDDGDTPRARPQFVHRWQTRETITEWSGAWNLYVLAAPETAQSAGQGFSFGGANSVEEFLALAQ